MSVSLENVVLFPFPFPPLIWVGVVIWFFGSNHISLSSHSFGIFHPFYLCHFMPPLIPSILLLQRCLEFCSVFAIFSSKTFALHKNILPLGFHSVLSPSFFALKCGSKCARYFFQKRERSKESKGKEKKQKKKKTPSVKPGN
jgi:hypothetical protein